MVLSTLAADSMLASTAKVFISYLLLSSALVSGAAIEPQHQLNSVDDALSEPKANTGPGKAAEDGAKAGATNSEAVSSNTTVFNGMDVPPMKDLTGEGMEEEIRNGYWFIKHFSPYCHHCTAIAPTWQTLYEFYYTSKPVPSDNKASNEGDSMNSFSRYYDFHFASLDCIAYGDACSKHDIGAFPTFSVYKDGKLLKKFEEKKDMEHLSQFVEGLLETIRPGSRPPDGVKLPEEGATSVEDGNAAVSSGKEKAAPAATSASAAATMESKESSTSKAEVSDSDSSKSSGTKSKDVKKAKKVSAPANPNGYSVDLSQESFQKLVTNTQDPWFVKFYAPWCHHCQALAPSWAQMATELQNKLNVGEVNCEKESRLCKDVHVKAYPTIHFFRGGERVEYLGLRGMGDLVSYAKKALDVGSGVPHVNETTFKKLEETEEVIFVYFYDHATTSEDFEALERLTLSLVGHARLVKTDDKALADRFKISTWPRLMVSRDGRPKYYDVLAPKEMRDVRQVLNWMQSVWLPLVPELTAGNAREIMQGKYVVVAILSRERADEFVLGRREMKNAALDWMEKQTHAFELERQELRDAKQLRLEEAEDRNDDRAKRAAKSIHIDLHEDDKKQVGFAWVDGIFWERWIRTTYGISVKDGERVIINDEDVRCKFFCPFPLFPYPVHMKLIRDSKQNHRYWETTISGAPIMPSRTSILETIPKVIATPPKIASKHTTGFLQRTFFGIRGLSSSHPWISTLLLLGIVVGVYGWFKRRLLTGSGAGGPGWSSNTGGGAWNSSHHHHHHGHGHHNGGSGTGWGFPGLLGGGGGGEKRKGGGAGSGGFFHLDGKEGLLNGGPTGKAD